jgi:ATP-dependent RNA helicase RhlE
LSSPIQAAFPKVTRSKGIAAQALRPYVAATLRAALHEIPTSISARFSNKIRQPRPRGMSPWQTILMPVWSRTHRSGRPAERFQMTFRTLGLAEPIARALSELGHVEPTPIQAAAIPVVLAGRDLIGIAQTGTGKTAAFALPILNQLAARPKPRTANNCRVLILSPTRELSVQIADGIRNYGRYLSLRIEHVIGGAPIGRQIGALRNGVDVLVATPGRLLDLCRTNAVRLDGVEFLVLDEADRMLDLGFIHDIRRIVELVPRKRQTLLFSATMPADISRLADEMTPPASVASRVDQRVMHVGRADKPGLLATILSDEPIDRALVFTRTKHGADKVVRNLAKGGITAAAIHGNKSQGQREKVLGAFRDGRVRNLIATDIAARGIDVTGISHVINYDLPGTPETYVHRIGRTARAGSSGVAISLCSGEERASLRSIEKLIRIALPVAGDPAAMPVPPEAMPVKGRSARQRKNQATRAVRRSPHGNDIGAIPFMKTPPRRADGRSA